MRAITVCQPYAHLIAIGEKPIENRTWSTPFTGELAIHAGKSRDWLAVDDDTTGMAFGAIVAVVRMVACKAKPDRVIPSWRQWAHLFHHEHAQGPWCFILEDVRRLPRPIACRGAQGFWDVPADVERSVRAQIERVAG